jgi:multicomponent Na+:H+ antiporter subunit G
MWREISLTEILSILSLIIGTGFMFMAALGIWLLPDIYMRIHAPTKAATLGLFFLILAFVLNTWEQGIPFKILLVLLFIGATIPIGSHIVARSAYRAGTGLKAPLTRDEYREANPEERSP